MPDENGKPTYEELEEQVIGLQGMQPEFLDNVAKAALRSAELSGMLRQKEFQLMALRTQLLKQGELLAKKHPGKKGEADATAE